MDCASQLALGIGGQLKSVGKAEQDRLPVCAPISIFHPSPDRVFPIQRQTLSFDPASRV